MTDAELLAQGVALILEFRSGFTAFHSAFEQDSPHSPDGEDLAARMDAWVADVGLVP